MVRDATIIDPRDRDIEAVLRECGVITSTLAASALSTLAHPSAKQPEVLVLDLRGSSKALPALAALKRHHPSTPVAAVLAAADAQLLVEAMRSGVNEVLIEPLAVADVSASLARLETTGVPAAETGDIFAFIGAKGGVGTTTAAVNVATALFRLGPEAKTLLVDLHLTHGDAAVFLGAEPRFSIVEALENTHRFDEAFFKGLVTATKAGPDLLASSDRALVSSTTVQHVQTLLRFASGLYRYVVLDVPRSDAATLDALDCVSQIVVVANQELPTVRSASRIAAALRQRYGKDRVKVIVSRHDHQADIGHEDIERTIGVKIKHAVPSDYREALQALNRGRPLTMENHNKLASAYVRIARDLSGISAEKTTASGASEPGLFGWFSGKRT